MRILHIYKDYYPIEGGIENHIRNLAEAQAASGHDVQVLVTNPGAQKAQEQLNGVQVMRAPRLVTVASTPLSVILPWTLGRLRPQIIHLHFPYPLGEVSYLGWGRGLPMVLSYHSDVVKQKRILRLYQPLLRRVLSHAGRIIVGSDAYIQSSPFLRPFVGKCQVIPYAVDSGFFAGGQPIFAPVDGQALLFLGKHRYYKGVDDLLRAMIDIDAPLLIGGDGPMRREWEQLAQDLGVAPKVTFLGDIPHAQLPDFYASGSLFILPSNSRAEAFGKVLQEAMAAGLPCVTTALGTGTSFVVRNGESGFVVSPRSPQELATAVNALLADEMLRKRMGASGQRRAKTEFTRANLVHSVAAVYAQLLGAN
jgi:rhamnosyl/mannosyltransferase